MTTQNLLKFSQKELQNISSNPAQESQWVMSFVLKIPSGKLCLKEYKQVTLEQESQIKNIIHKRKEGWPLSYLLKETFFRDKKFFIVPGVFIPREESYLIVDQGVQIQKSPLKFVDFGAGAGPLCLSILEERPDSLAVAVEIDHASLHCLKHNATAKKLEKRINFLKKDVCQIQSQEIRDRLGNLPDLIVANPPYVKPHDQNLHREVYLFEPPLALFSDQEGMGHIYSWFYKAMELLPSQGHYIFEFGYDQSEKVQEFLSQQQEINSYHLYKDDENHDRIAYCVKK